jgi:uncharacterized cupin superfamily protein
MTTLVLEPAIDTAIELSPETTTSGDLTFRLQANMRRGTGSSLHGTWSSYASVDDARLVAREMLRDDRVTHVTVVTDTVPPRFVEWVNR